MKLIHLTDTHLVPKGENSSAVIPGWFWMPPSPTSTLTTPTQNFWS